MSKAIYRHFPGFGQKCCGLYYYTYSVESTYIYDLFIVYRMLNFASCYGPTHSLTPSPISTQDRLKTYACFLAEMLQTQFYSSKFTVTLIISHYANQIFQSKYCNNLCLLQYVHPRITKNMQPLVEMCLIFPFHMYCFNLLRVCLVVHMYTGVMKTL